MESDADTPNIDQTGFTGVALIQVIQDEVKDRSIGSVDGVGEGDCRLYEAQRLCQR